MTDQSVRTPPPLTAGHRLAVQPGEVLDRRQSIGFTWNGRPYTGFGGDTIVSALAAGGVRVFSRSFKYHRPRGLLTADYHDPGTILQVDDEPNVRAAHRLLAEGMRVSSQNTWPSLRFDAKAVNQLAGRFLTAGFYYKTFIKPERLWPTYEKVLQRFTHAGRISPDTPHDYYDKRYVHPDVLVAGGGPAGMAAAVAAARAGAQVLLVDESHQLGGHLRWGGPADLTALGELRDEVDEQVRAGRLEVMSDAAVLARYDGNWVAVVQRGLPGIPERLVKARVGALVVAPGLIERPYVFAGNDVPGVMLSTAVRRLVNLYGVRPGERAVVFTANAEGDAAAHDLRRIGVDVAEVVDARRGQDVVRVHGRSGVRAVELADGRKIAADLLVTATGWTAPTALLNQSGDRPVYSPKAARFVPGGAHSSDVLVTGGLAGDGDRAALVAHGRSVGAAAAGQALNRRGRRLTMLPTRADSTGRLPDAAAAQRITALPVADHPELFRGRTHGIVDFSEDVSSKDIMAAAREGYDSVELLKRYTTATMGPAQGKLETVNTVAILAEATGSTIAETGTTTWRPMHVPVTLGALAGRIFEPVRYSPMQPAHDRLGAAPLIAGQWIRPDHYGDPVEEVRAVREKVGIIDVTPIGKLDLRGPDVPALLNQLYINKWSKLGVGRVRYGVMCAEDGVVLDDGVTGRLGEDHYLMSTTSSGAGAIWEWVENWLQTEHPEWRVHVTPVTTAYASINVAGPRSRELLGRLVEGVDLDLESFGYMQVRTGRIAGVPDCVLWRIGFTGELSYELHVPAGYGLHVWDALLEHGADFGVRPFGVEAQRILRLEKGHLIVGQDTDGLTKASGAGLDWAVKLDKPDFVGKPELVWDRAQGGGPRLVGLNPLDPSLVPPEASQIIVEVEGQARPRIVGRITSSRMSPTLRRGVCLAQLDAALAEPGTEVTVRLPDGRSVRAAVADHLAAVDPDGERQNIASEGPVGPPRLVDDPVAHSPIEPGGEAEVRSGWLVDAGGNTARLMLTDLSPLTKISVKATPDGAAAKALDVRFGRCARGGLGDLVIGSGPGEWLVLGGVGTQSALAEQITDVVAGREELVSIVDLTHGRALLRLTGADASRLLAKVCAIDLSDDMTPDGAALRSSVAKLVTDLVRDDQDGTPSYLLHCERSSGAYLRDALRDAGAEFGIGVGGFPITGN